jgi:hypothetical protein
MCPYQERAPKQPSEDDGKGDPLGEAPYPTPLSFGNPRSDTASGPRGSIHAVESNPSRGRKDGSRVGLAIDMTRP